MWFSWRHSCPVLSSLSLYYLSLSSLSLSSLSLSSLSLSSLSLSSSDVEQGAKGEAQGEQKAVDDNGGRERAYHNSIQKPEATDLVLASCRPKIRWTLDQWLFCVQRCLCEAVCINRELIQACCGVTIHQKPCRQEQNDAGHDFLARDLTSSVCTEHSVGSGPRLRV
jgi:hypothetical protein